MSLWYYIKHIRDILLHIYIYVLKNSKRAHINEA